MEIRARDHIFRCCIYTIFHLFSVLTHSNVRFYCFVFGLYSCALFFIRCLSSWCVHGFHMWSKKCGSSIIVIIIIKATLFFVDYANVRKFMWMWISERILCRFDTIFGYIWTKVPSQHSLRIEICILSKGHRQNIVCVYMAYRCHMYRFHVYICGNSRH